MPVLVRTMGTRGRGVRADVLARRGERMLRAVGRPRSELSVLLCDDGTIRDLNLRWRRIDAPTDVLAFPLAEGEPEDGAPLGDVVVSVDTTRRQARELGSAIASRATFLLAHGLLHLLGYDHRDRGEERRMTAMTDALVAASRGGRRPGEKPVEKPRSARGRDGSSRPGRRTG